METYPATCPFCDWKGSTAHLFLGQARSEMYQHFDKHPTCSDQFAKQRLEKLL